MFAYLSISKIIVLRVFGHFGHSASSATHLSHLLAPGSPLEPPLNGVIFESE